MKKLLNRFSRVADSHEYSRLPSDARPRRTSTFLSFKPRRSATPGPLPVCVGEEMQRYDLNVSLLHNPIFIRLLEKSAEVYGYEHEGVLRIPCNARDFEIIIAAANRNTEITPEIQNIIDSIQIAE